MAEQTNQEQQTAPTPNFDKWKNGIIAKNPDIDPNDMEALYGASSSGYDTEHDYAKKNRAEVEKLGKILQDNPDVAAFYEKLIASDGDAGEAFASLSDVIKAYASGEIDSEGYRNAVNAQRAKKAEMDAGQQAGQAAFEEVCQELGIDPEETATQLQEKLFEPMASAKMTKEVWKTLINMLNYDEDVEAARVQGRNENINARRKKDNAATDGLPKGGSPSAKATTDKPDVMDQMVNSRAARRRL